MGLLITFVVLAISISFLCSIMEAVILSVTPSYVAALEKKRPASGRRIRALKQDIDRPLAAILSLNTIAHTFGAVGAGAEAAIVFGSAYVGIFSAGLTLAILFLSEIIPKSLGALFWRQLAPTTARLLGPTMVLLWPLVAISQKLTRLLSRGRAGFAVRRDEITAIAEQGARDGLFQRGESRILHGLFRLESLRAKHIMTPRIVLEAVPQHDTVHDVMATHQEFRFSRLPVYDEDLDDVTGYVLKDDILLRAARGEHQVTLSDLKREILVIPEMLPLPELLERLLNGKEHIALVVDEYGGTAGVVSMEDVVETVLGMEIVDEADSVKDMQQLAREQWLTRAKKLGVVGEDFTEEPRAAHPQE